MTPQLALSFPHPRLDVPQRKLTDAIIAAHGWLRTEPSADERAEFAAHVHTILPTRIGGMYCGALTDLLRSSDVDHNAISTVRRQTAHGQSE